MGDGSILTGGIKTREELGLGGDHRETGVYPSPEVTADLGHDLYVTVGGYWLRGSIDSRRAYLNGDTDFRTAVRMPKPGARKFGLTG
jgi:hypothetical protein